MYGYDTWLLALRKEHRLMVFENRMLRRISGAKWNEVKVEWTKLHNEDLNNLYSSLSIVWLIKSRRIECGVK